MFCRIARIRDEALDQKRARTIAILHQTSYALEFREGVVRLLPLAQAGQIERRTAGGRRVGGEPVEQAGEHMQYVLENGMTMAIRRWDSEAWLGTDKNSIHVWRFDPTGLCEPISLRLSLDKSWSEDSYHPLTATIRESIRETR